MGDEAEDQEQWPPAPLFRPALPKPRVAQPPLWIVIGINAGASLLLGVWWGHHRWHEHRGPDWWGAVFVGGCLFAGTTAGQLWTRRTAGVLNRERARLESEKRGQ